MGVRVLAGDALVRLAELEAGSVAAVVTDPPYGLEFMSVAWDTFNDGRKGGARTPNTWGDHGSKEHPRNAYETAHIAAKKNRAFGEFSQAWAVEVLRVLKPGGYLLAFGGTRTYHRLTCAIEDSGFQVRDCLMWLYGSGFPKGKGCLKPGWEPIVLARKPAPAPWLNVDGCRIEGVTPACSGTGFSTGKFAGRNGIGEPTMRGVQRPESTAGRWPANVMLSHEPECREVGTKRVKGITGGFTPGSTGAFGKSGIYSGANGERSDRIKTGHADADGIETIAAFECAPECAVRLLDEQSGERGGSGKASGPTLTGTSTSNSRGQFNGVESTPFYGDTGGASRFFYCSKASPAERRSYNDHPTVKPLSLCSWLVKLVTPPGGTVLDPFCGSGSVLIAADRLGFDAIGIDSDPHAIEITERRLRDEGGLFADVEVAR